MHMHDGVEEMFFVLSGTADRPYTRGGGGSRHPVMLVYFPEGSEVGCTRSMVDQPVRMLGISTKRFPRCRRLPRVGESWVATRHPERP